MNKVSKIISVALVLILALSVMVMPTSAATTDYSITAEVVATKMGQVTVSEVNYDYYKFSVYLDSTLSLTGYELNLTWDSNVWQKLHPTTLKDNNVFTNKIVPITADPENIMYTESEAYQNYGGGMWEDADATNGYVLMPGDGTAPTLAKISNTNMGEGPTAAGYTGIYSTWMVDFTDCYATLSGGTVNGKNSPTSGRQMVLSWYMRLKTTEPGDYTVGFNDGQLHKLRGVVNTNDAFESLQVGADKVDIDTSKVTYKNATVTVAAEASPVYAKGSQIRFNGLETAGTGSAPIDVRARAAMTAEDFAAICGDDEAAKTAITEVGFYFVTDGEVDVNNLAAATKKPVTHIQKLGDEYVWTCLVEGADSNGTLSAVGYITVGGTTYTFDAASLTNINDLYTRNYASYAATQA